MRRILIVGAGHSGLMLALGLLDHGYDVTLMSDRTSDEARTGRVTSTQLMFPRALAHEREFGIDRWADRAPTMRGLGITVAGPDGTPALDWIGDMGGPVQSVDQRVKMPAWMDLFVERGGNLVVHGVTLSDLDWYSRSYDLVVVAAGKGDIVNVFGRDAGRSPFTTPQRALAVAYVNGVEQRPADPYLAAHGNIVPGCGELFMMSCLTTTGPCDILFFEALPGGPFDVFEGLRDPKEHLARSLDLIRTHIPWEYERVSRAELTDANGTLAGRFAPVVRNPVAELPSGGVILGIGDVVVANDPQTAQGANSAAKTAAHYLARILAHGDRPFDADWMRETFEIYWESVGRFGVRFTNAMVSPPPEHALAILGTAQQVPDVANRFIQGFDNPADLDPWFYEPEAAFAYLGQFAPAADGS